ncbi:error-prone repair homolog of DNA polymerase III [Cutibacterium acnes JCM 18918]|nr:error-prone repair homolog of DNA polymerase III [Cutibacterium acnes JCM 18918]
MTFFGIDNVLVELTDHRAPTDSRDNDLLAELASRHSLLTVATTAAHYAGAEQFELACACQRCEPTQSRRDGRVVASRSGGAAA